jgi:hypothetical protein
MQAMRDLARATHRGPPSERRQRGRQGMLLMIAAMLPEAHKRMHALMLLDLLSSAG